MVERDYRAIGAQLDIEDIQQSLNGVAHPPAWQDTGNDECSMKTGPFSDRQKRVKAVLKIVGNQHSDNVMSVVQVMIRLQEQWESKRAQRWSKVDKVIANRYLATLKRTIYLTKKTPSRWWDWMESEQSLQTSRAQFLRQLDFLSGISLAVAFLPLPRRGGPNEAAAYAKVLAAHTALIICRQTRIKPSTTRTGAFCRMAAALFGDATADLQYQCRQILKFEERSKKPARK